MQTFMLMISFKAKILAQFRNTSRGRTRWCGTTFWFVNSMKLSSERNGLCLLYMAALTSRTSKMLVINLLFCLWLVGLGTMQAHAIYAEVSTKKDDLQTLSKWSKLYTIMLHFVMMRHRWWPHSFRLEGRFPSFGLRSRMQWLSNQISSLRNKKMWIVLVRGSI